MTDGDNDGDDDDDDGDDDKEDIMTLMMMASTFQTIYPKLKRKVQTL